MQIIGPCSWIRVLAPDDRLLGMFGTESSCVMNPGLLFQTHIVHGPDVCLAIRSCWIMIPSKATVVNDDE